MITNKLNSHSWIGIACASLWILAPLAPAQEPDAALTRTDAPPDVASLVVPQSDLTSISGSEGSSGNGLPASFRDDAFERFFDLTQVAVAINSRDAVLLADVALSLAEGERVLARPHKSGVTAKALLEKSVLLAANREDKATLDRLGKAAEKRQDKELASQIANITKLDSASRVIDPALTISINAINFETVHKIKDLLNGIENARLFGDPKLFDEIDSKLMATSDIPEIQRNAIAKLAYSARTASLDEAKLEIDSLAKLRASSRDLGWVKHPEKWGKGPVVPSHEATSSVDDPPDPPVQATLVNRWNRNINIELWRSSTGWQKMRLVTNQSFSIYGNNVWLKFSNGQGEVRQLRLEYGKKYTFKADGSAVEVYW